MAGDIPPLNIDIQVALGNLTSAVDKATSELGKVGDAAKNQESKFSSLKTVMGGVFAGNLMTEGVQKLTGLLESSVKAAQDAQVSTVQLATAMNNAKVNTEANRTAVEKSVTAMENLAFTGNDTRAAMTTLVTATGSVTESQKLMGLAADLARAKHESLGEAASTLSRATTGSAKAFKEFGITLDTTLPKNQAISKAMDELNQKIGGQAQAYLGTYAGQMELIKTKMEAAKETIGGALLPVLTNLMQMFSDILGVIKPILPELTILIGIVGAVVIAVKAWEMAQAALDVVLNANPISLIVLAIGALIAAIVMAWNHSKTFRDIVVDVMKAVVEAVGWVIGALGDLVTAFIKIESGPLKLFLGALSHLPFVGGGAKAALKMINEGTQDVGNFFDSAKKKIDGFAGSLDSLKNSKLSFGGTSGDLSGGATSGGGTLDIGGQVPGGSTSKVVAATAKALAKRNAEIKKYNDEAVNLEDQMNAVLTDRQQKMDAATATRDDALAKDNETYNQSVADINQKYDDAMATAQDNYNTAVENATATHQENLLNIQQQYADKAAQLEQSAADKRQSIIQQSIDVMTNAFASATKIDIGTLFTTGGTPSILSQSTVNGITTTVVGAATGTADSLKSALQSKLADILKLQKDAGDLAAKGYNQSFIDEVIAQGPAQGDALAQSVLNATPDTQNSIKSLYAQIQDTSQNGLNTLAAQMNDGASFATQALAQQYAQVGIDLQTQLSANSNAMQTAMDKENDTFNKSLTTAQDTLNKATKAATDARDLALQKAQDTLQNSITAAQDAFSKSVTAISDSTMKQLDALQSELEATAASLTSLGASTASISSYGASGGLTPTPTFNAAPSLRNQPYGPGIPNPVIGSLTQNVYTTDPSLPSLSTALTTAITLGQTQGIIPASAVVSNYASSGTSMRRGD